MTSPFVCLLQTMWHRTRLIYPLKTEYISTVNKKMWTQLLTGSVFLESVHLELEEKGD